MWWLWLFRGGRQGGLPRMFDGPGGLPPVIAMSHGRAIVRDHIDEPRGEVPESRQGLTGVYKGGDKRKPLVRGESGTLKEEMCGKDKGPRALRVRAARWTQIGVRLPRSPSVDIGFPHPIDVNEQTIRDENHRRVHFCEGTLTTTHPSCLYQLSLQSRAGRRNIPT